VLAPAQRLRRRAEFAVAVRVGRRGSRGSLVVHLMLPNVTDVAEPARADQRPARAGFVVSRAVGGAVVRNRVRRRLRHLVAQLLPTLPPGTDLVVRALPAAAGRPSAELAADLDAALAAARRPRGNTRRRAEVDR
jgi:ribonuclease P protein component